MNYRWEFVLMMVICSPLLFIVDNIKRQGRDVMRSRMKSEMDRHKAIKSL